MFSENGVRIFMLRKKQPGTCGNVSRITLLQKLKKSMPIY